MSSATHTGIVSKVIYLCPRTGFCVFILSPSKGKKKDGIKCVGTRPDLTVGSSVVVKGEVINDPQRGEQFKCSTIQVRIMESNDTLEAFLRSSYIKGVGKVLAKRIVNHFGEDARDVVMNNTDRLSEVKGFTSAKIEEIKRGIKNAKKVNEVYEFLAPAQITDKAVKKIFDMYGDDTMSLLSEDCYRLCLDLEGFGFIKSDIVARGIGYKLNDPRRIDSALNYVLKTESDSSGDCYVSESSLITKTCSLINVNVDEVIERLNIVVKSKGRLSISSMEIDGTRFYAYSENIRFEEKISSVVASLINQKSFFSSDSSPLKEVIEELKSEGSEPNEEQIRACECAINNKISFIMGGPGTGKTTTSRAIVNTFVRMGVTLSTVAPTGKATVRIESKTGHPSRTIPSFVYRGGESEVIIVDESSMINYQTVYLLLNKHPKAHYVFIGDKDQLPPIGVGCFFRDMCELDSVAKVELLTVMRQGEGSSIVSFLNSWKNGSIEIPSLIEKEDLDKQDALMVRFANKNTYLEKLPSLYNRLSSQYKDIQVITCRKDGDFGTKNLNRIIREIVNPDIGQKSVSGKGYDFRIGDRVIFTQNDLNKTGVANGDTGFVEDIVEVVDDNGNKGKALQVRLDTGTVVEYSEIFSMDHAYALTTHKTQGSEFDAVIFFAFTEAYTLLSKNIVYTACSRPQKKLVVMSDSKALHIALQKGDIGERFTRLKSRISELLEVYKDLSDISNKRLA